MPICRHRDGQDARTLHLTETVAVLACESDIGGIRWQAVAARFREHPISRPEGGGRMLGVSRHDRATSVGPKLFAAGEQGRADASTTHRGHDIDEKGGCHGLLLERELDDDTPDD